MSWKRKFLLSGFNSKESALEKSRYYALKNGILPDATTKYLFSVEPLFQEHWGLIIPEDFLEILEEKDKYSNRFQEIYPEPPILNVYIPIVFRYMKKKYVDDFFKTGKLKLSSFKKFHQHKDEQRGDKTEGNNIIHAKSKDSSFVSVHSSGQDAFVLSTALTEDVELMNEFQCDDYLIIKDSQAFINEVGNKVPELKRMLFGPCIYQKNKIIESEVPNFNVEEFKVEGGIDANQLFNIPQKVGGDHVFFVKNLEFKPQHEYRFLWFSMADNLPDELNIYIPEARDYCDRYRK